LKNREDFGLAIGRVIRAIGGFYYVEPLGGRSQLVECSVRGKLKLNIEGLLVGDKVEYSVEELKGVINEILPRETVLKRPYIANVNLIVLVFAHKNPDPNEFLVTKFLTLAEASGIPYLVVFNKSDLVGKGNANQLANIYRNYGYQVLCTSVIQNLGQRLLKRAISGKVTVFAGPSGVGKSALLNMIAPGFKLQTGVVSEKIGRGKHTTREVQLLRVNQESYAADTPGFSQIDFDFLEPAELSGLFLDFEIYRNACKFNTCMHQTESDCGIKTAVAEGKIKPERYQTYLELLEEVKNNWKNRYR
jgi:ribosome biogenesis GTPase / thiamine phosphate phosphatase